MTFSLEKIEDIALISIDAEGEKVNKLTKVAMLELENIINNINASAIVFISNKSGFIAGADISEIQNLDTPQKAKELSSEGQRIFNMIEDLNIPSIAAINGACLGGGCEFVLTCDYRIATKTATIGLPETKLGVIPGLGGTFRLPRLIGIANALDIILRGKSVNAKKALKIGLIDELVSDEILKRRALEVAKKIKKRESIFELKDVLQIIIKPVILNIAKTRVLKKTGGHYPAPLKALELISKSKSSSRTKALEQEATAFSELATGEVAKNLIELYFQSNKAKKLFPRDVTPKEVKSIAVLGSGVMGGGIASLAAEKNIEAIMKDINLKALLAGFKAARKIWKRKNKYQYQKCMDKLSATLDYSGFSKLDVVIEAVVENMEVKKKVINELKEKCDKDCIIATNTSSLSVYEMGGGSKNFVGMHFFNPVHRMPLVEVVKTKETSNEAVATIFELAKRMGKIPIIVKDSPGFLVNRLLLPYLNEALYLLEDGYSIITIDKCFVDFGLPMGPLRLLDEVGIDVASKVANIFHEAFGDRAKPSEIMEKLVSLERFGKKTKKGFYIYTGHKAVPDSELYDKLGIKLKNSSNQSAKDEITSRGLCVMINEAKKALKEKVVDEEWVLDLAMVMGIGFPPFRGGLMKYTNLQGDAITEFLDHWYDKTGHPRFKTTT